MSWSTGAQKGTPQEVKDKLQPIFESCKKNTDYVPAENKSVLAAEAMVNDLLDAMIESGHQVVTVSAHGSATTSNGKLINIGCTVSVSPY